MARPADRPWRFSGHRPGGDRDGCPAGTSGTNNGRGSWDLYRTARLFRVWSLHTQSGQVLPHVHHYRGMAHHALDRQSAFVVMPDPTVSPPATGAAATGQAIQELFLDVHGLIFVLDWVHGCTCGNTRRLAVVSDFAARRAPAGASASDHPPELQRWSRPAGTSGRDPTLRPEHGRTAAVLAERGLMVIHFSTISVERMREGHTVMKYSHFLWISLCAKT
jgi:hypothetical protein